MPAVFANPYASRSQHISSLKIAQLRLKDRGCYQTATGFLFAKSFNPPKAGKAAMAEINSDPLLS